MLLYEGDIELKRGPYWQPKTTSECGANERLLPRIEFQMISKALRKAKATTIYEPKSAASITYTRGCDNLREEKVENCFSKTRSSICREFVCDNSRKRLLPRRMGTGVPNVTWN